MEKLAVIRRGRDGTSQAEKQVAVSSGMRCNKTCWDRDRDKSKPAGGWQNE